MSEFEEKLLNRLKLVEREIERLKVWERSLTTVTPTASAVPKADAGGKLAVGWMPVGQTFVPLTTPLTSTAWDWGPRSTTAKTLIDLSAVFGAPAAIKAIVVNVMLGDSSSAATDCYFILSSNDTALFGMWASCQAVNDRNSRQTMIVSCDANGDVYFQCAASGVGTLDVSIQITGYWL